MQVVVFFVAHAIQIERFNICGGRAIKREGDNKVGKSNNFSIETMLLNGETLGSNATLNNQSCGDKANETEADTIRKR